MEFLTIFLIIMGSLFIFCLIGLFVSSKSMEKWIEVKFLHENNLIDYDCLHEQKDLFNYNRYKKSGCPALTNKLYKAILYVEAEVAKKAQVQND